MVNSFDTFSLSALLDAELSCINPEIAPLICVDKTKRPRTGEPLMIEQSSAPALAAAEFWQAQGPHGKDVRLYCGVDASA
jgi:hypothetical protein